MEEEAVEEEVVEGGVSLEEDEKAPAATETSFAE